MQSPLNLLSRQPLALWGYVLLSMLIVVIATVSDGSISIEVNIWLAVLWVGLLIATMRGSTLGRSVLAAMSVVGFLQIALLASRRYGIEEIVISLSLITQVALLCSPAFRVGERA